MSKELVIEARTRALFNKFWDQFGSNPQWLKDVFRDNPPILDKLLKAFIANNPAAEFQQVVSMVRDVAREEAKQVATAQVNELSPVIIDWVQDTFENQ